MPGVKIQDLTPNSAVCSNRVVRLAPAVKVEPPSNQMEYEQSDKYLVRLATKVRPASQYIRRMRITTGTKHWCCAAVKMVKQTEIYWSTAQSAAFYHFAPSMLFYMPASDTECKSPKVYAL